MHIAHIKKKKKNESVKTDPLTGNAAAEWN